MKILYIDNQDNIKILVPFFTRKAITVDKEDNVDKGLYLATVNSYDIIILDYTIAKNICIDLRKNSNKTPIIFLIDSKEPTSKNLNALEIGADDFIRKPIVPEELYLRIVSILRRPKEYIGNYIEFGNFCLDINNKRFYYGDNYIALTKKEISLIDFFMRNKDILLTKDDILENVWDMNANPFSNVVEVYIRSIRNKIKEYSNKEFIHNIQGMGYYIGEINKIKKNNFYNNNL